MSRRLFSHSLPRDIFDVSREIRMLTSQHLPSPPTSENLAVSTLLLPDVRTPTQYLMDMGFKPALARRISSVYMDFVARYRQIFRSHFHRAIHGTSLLNTEYYHKIFVIQFKGTIQVWESQIMSAAWDWLHRTGLSPLHLNRCIEVRVDDATKPQILLRLGLMTTSSVMNNRALATELPEEESKTEGDSPTKTLPVSSPPSRQSTTIPTCDPFSQETSSTCFPAYYPPPLDESISSPRKPLITQFSPTSSINREKASANRYIDTSSLVTTLSRMSVTTSEVGRKIQDSRKCIWSPRSKEPEPLPPLLSPVVAGQSDSLPRPSSPNAETVSCAKSNPAPRKRRIAALPTRHVRTTALPTLVSSSPSAYPLVSAPTANGAMLNNPFPQVAKTSVTELPLGSPSATVRYGPPIEVQCTTGTSDNVGSKSVLSTRRKTRPLPRRVTSQSQTPPAPTRPSTPLAPSRQRISFSNVSRTPSLVSDTSSCADPHSSDEFDTPPSTPPSYSHGLTACNALAVKVNSKSRTNSIGPFGLPILANADYANPRRGKFIHIDFTNGDAIGERQLSFTFRA